MVASDRAVFYRERSSGMYGSLVFAAAQGFAEAPFLFVQSVVYVCIVYSTTQFEFDSAKAMWFWWVDCGAHVCGICLGVGLGVVKYVSKEKPKTQNPGLGVDC